MSTQIIQESEVTTGLEKVKAMEVYLHHGYTLEIACLSSGIESSDFIDRYYDKYFEVKLAVENARHYYEKEANDILSAVVGIGKQAIAQVQDNFMEGQAPKKTTVDLITTATTIAQKRLDKNSHIIDGNSLSSGMQGKQLEEEYKRFRVQFANKFPTEMDMVQAFRKFKGLEVIPAKVQPSSGGDEGETTDVEILSKTKLAFDE